MIDLFGIAYKLETISIYIRYNI